MREVRTGIMNLTVVFLAFHALLFLSSEAGTAGKERLLTARNSFIRFTRLLLASGISVSLPLFFELQNSLAASEPAMSFYSESPSLSPSAAGSE